MSLNFFYSGRPADVFCSIFERLYMQYGHPRQPMPIRLVGFNTYYRHPSVILNTNPNPADPNHNPATFIWWQKLTSIQRRSACYIHNYGQLTACSALRIGCCTAAVLPYSMHYLVENYHYVCFCSCLLLFRDCIIWFLFCSGHSTVEVVWNRRRL